MTFRKLLRSTALVLMLCISLASCTTAPSISASSGDGLCDTTLTLAAYTTPREAYSELIPMFQEIWLEQTGEHLCFEESYLGSGAQSRAIVEGFEADIAALSLAADIIRIEEAGLITHDWQNAPSNGMITRSIVVFAVREGNPADIEDWDDLAEPGLEILTPNPKTSGGAMWNILALYGAAERGKIPGVPADNQAAAEDFLLSVLNNVTVMDKGARESITNFERGIGDLAITYENEVLAGQLAGQTYEAVIPGSTILIENPAAVIDTWVDKHGTREAAEAFLSFLLTPEAQEIFSRCGLRPVHPESSDPASENFAPVEDLFTVDYLGGWDEIIPGFFGENGIYSRTSARINAHQP